MAPRSDDFDRYSPETKIALLRQDLVALHREVDDLRDDIRALERRPLLDEAQARELCRRIVAEETAGDTSIRDNMMRVVTLVCTVVTVIFVIRGGR